MLQKATKALVADTSGAGWVQLFHLYRGSWRRYARLGDFVKSAVKVIAFYPRYVRGKRYRPLRVGYVVRGLVTQARASARFCDNTRMRFMRNAVILLKRRGVFKSKVIPGPQPRTIRRRQYQALFDAYV